MGVTFPLDPRLGRASTTAMGRSVFASAAHAIDADLGAAVDAEPDWRHAYPRHVRRIAEAAAISAPAALAAAKAALVALHASMEFERDEQRLPLGKCMAALRVDAPATETVTGQPHGRSRELELPYGSDLLRGAALHRQLDRWVAAGIVEPSLAEAVRLVMANPDWLR
ncbi:MAG TPA: hypothetical protein VFR46_06925, partial [Actinomycetes bacterium]|nr:hypothetical protein [Actinomycetes bacterium]